MTGRAVVIAPADAVGRELEHVLAIPRVDPSHIQAQLPDLLTHVETIVYAAIDQDPDLRPTERLGANIARIEQVLALARAANVRHLILLSSTMVYGVRELAQLPIHEQDPAQYIREDGQPGSTPTGLAGDYAAVEQAACHAAEGSMPFQVDVVRAAPTLEPDDDTFITRHFMAPRLLGNRDTHMRWQFSHPADIARAILRLRQVRTADLPLLRESTSTAHSPQTHPTGAESVRLCAVASHGFLSQDEAAQLLQMRRMDMPEVLLFRTAQRLYRAGVVATPAAELRFLTAPWVVQPEALTQSGWAPQHQNAEIVQRWRKAQEQAAQPQRRGKDAAVVGASAAGIAAVIMLGTAIVVKKLRRGRSGA